MSAPGNSKEEVIEEDASELKFPKGTLLLLLASF